MKKIIVTFAILCAVVVVPTQAAEPKPPTGYKAIFNGRDLSGWYGWNPHESTRLKDEKLAANLKKQREDFAKHWRVENGELVNNGTGPYATTSEEYGDIDLLIDYKTVPKADSGIYLRGTPQVQIWDINQASNPKSPDRNPNKGSGGLFNNTPKTPGRDPLVVADKAFGEWNSFRIRQVGVRTWVWLNEKLVVDGAIMENYWDRTKALPAKGPIMLQTHGGEIRWRNIYIREIKPEEAEKILKEAGPVKKIGFNADPESGLVFHAGLQNHSAVLSGKNSVPKPTNVNFSEDAFFGKGAKVASFDGWSSHLEIPADHLPRMGAQDFSISLWVHSNSVDGDNPGDLLCQYDAVKKKA